MFQLIASCRFNQTLLIFSSRQGVELVLLECGDNLPLGKEQIVFTSTLFFRS